MILPVPTGSPAPNIRGGGTARSLRPITNVTDEEPEAQKAQATVP